MKLACQRDKLTYTAWYFWNTTTGEVTWTNPLDPTSSSAPSAPPLPPGPDPPAATPSLTLPSFGAIPEIDPDLAYLLPPESRDGPGAAGSQQALFNARNGKFTASDYRYTVDHLDEYNRAKRMNSHYFDQDAWEREKALENAKRKRNKELGIVENKEITKKDMVRSFFDQALRCSSVAGAAKRGLVVEHTLILQERFKKKKLEKKFRSQAWLRD